MTYFFLNLFNLFSKMMKLDKSANVKFHDCMAQRLAHLSDHIGASVKEIHRESKNGQRREVGLSMFISLGHSETLSPNERLSTIITTSFCFADDFRTASKSTQIPNKDPQMRKSIFLVSYIFYD